MSQETVVPDPSESFVSRVSENIWEIAPGFVDNMIVPARFYASDALLPAVLAELRAFAARNKPGCEAFMPALKQLGNVASLPGICRYSIGLPDLHAGYGFAIGNVAAFDMEDPAAVVSPGGVGFDINCGVRLIRTNLTESDILKSDGTRDKVAQALYDHIPVGVGTKGSILVTDKDMEKALNEGMDWASEKGLAWPEDKEHCEEKGRMMTADSTKVSRKAKARGTPQFGTLGAGNHYCEVQVVDEIFDYEAATAMGINRVGQICIMIHSGSRGLGHQVATDALVTMEKAMTDQNIKINDKQLACARINSVEGENYLGAMSAAANYAWVNRSSMTHLARKAFETVFNKTAKELDMHVVYDVSHNIAKIEHHQVDGVEKKLLVHRKGSTRAFPPGHPSLPAAYQSIGQPVLIGGTMGTCSYVLTGTHKGMQETFGSTCHGAGRLLSRHGSRRALTYEEVLANLEKSEIAIRLSSPKLIMEEAPESYKDVTAVVDACHDAGISKKSFKLRPIAVIKG